MGLPPLPDSPLFSRAVRTRLDAYIHAACLDLVDGGYSGMVAL